MADTKINNQFIITGYLENQDNNTDIDLTGKIKSIAVKKDFNTDIMPLFVITLLVENNIREIIRKNNVKLAITCQEYNVPEDVDDISIYEPDVVKTTFNGIFKIFDKNLNQLDIIQDEENNEDTVTGRQMEITLNCIPEEIYNKNSKVINSVYRNASMNEILIDILNDGNNKLFIDPSDNSDRENTLLVPPLNVSNAISYLQNNYSIYSSPYKLFFDLDTTYLIKTKKENSYEINNLVINVLSKNNTSNSEIYDNIFIDSDNILTKYVRECPDVLSNEDTLSNILGGNMIIGSYGEAYELVTRSYINNPNENKVRYYWNPSRGQLKEESLNDIPSKTFSIILENVSPSHFNIKTSVILQSDNENLNGTYRIESLRYMFNTKDSKIFSNSIIINVVK